MNLIRISAFLLALLLAGCAAGPSRTDHLKPVAEPSEVVATELAFAREAREEGQWTAFRDYAADGAVMFVPERVNAKEWLKKRPDPAASASWQPHAVWSSCDGSLAVTRGGWQRSDGTVGAFATVWRRQKKGDYKWVLDSEETLASPLPAPEMISADVATCQPNAPAANVAPGWSNDRTLQWAVQRTVGGNLALIVRRWNGSGYTDVLTAPIRP